MALEATGNYARIFLNIIIIKAKAAMPTVRYKFKKKKGKITVLGLEGSNVGVRAVLHGDPLLVIN